MAILSDQDLKRIIEDKDAVKCVEGPEINTDLQLNPSSFDLRLGYEFGTVNTREIELIDTVEMDRYNEVIRRERHSAEDGMVVHPGEFVLGSTLETVKVPDDLAARVEGRSSYGRLGIIVHATAGYIDPGFKGEITLEIQNLGNAPVKLYPEERVCQIVFETMTSEALKPYGEKADSKYMNQKGATASKLSNEKR